MPGKRRQTRRAVSLRAEKFVRYMRAARGLGISLSHLVESVMDSHLDKAGWPEVPRDEALAELEEAAKSAARQATDEYRGGSFTF